MAEGNRQTNDPWSDGMSKLMDAGRANMTAFNLTAAGMVALTAGAAAYFWDPSRRNSFMAGAQKFSNTVQQMWGMEKSQPTAPEPGSDIPSG